MRLRGKASERRGKTVEYVIATRIHIMRALLSRLYALMRLRTKLAWTHQEHCC